MTLLEKSGFYLSICLVIVLLFFIIFAKHGAIDYKAMKSKEKQVIRQSAGIMEKNRSLENEIEKLKTDAEYIKHVAKHEYEMAEEGEIIFKDEDSK